MLKKASEIDIGIIGAGINGLFCGIMLLEAGFKNVKIYSKETTPNTTSDIAAAIWMPFSVEPRDKVEEWAKTSLAIYSELSKVKESGVVYKIHTEAFTSHIEKPWWMHLLQECRRPRFVPNQYICAYTVLMPIIDTSIFMPYLFQRYNELNGKTEIKEIKSLKELSNHKVIVNCAGIGSKKLVQDPDLMPASGQIIRVKKPSTFLEESFLHIGEEEITLVVPRTNDCIIGVTYQEGKWDASINLDIAQRMLRNAYNIFPQLKEAKIIEHRAGLRPIRSRVRLEYEFLNNDSLLIHNYGHGGGGVSLAPGCACKVVQHVLRYLNHSFDKS